MELNKILVVKSFEAVKPVANEFVEYFYQYLFTKYPGAKEFFKNTKMDIQKKQLLNSLVYIVDHLDQIDDLKEYLMKMGGRHTGYGVKPEHYELVGDSLIATLKYFFKDQWSQELEQAWIWAYQFISQTMIQGASKMIQNPKKESSGEAFSNPTEDVLSPLEKMSHDLARKMLYKALAEEVNDEFILAVREKARQILEKAILEEAQSVLTKNRDLKAA